MAIDLIEEAVVAGARRHKACAVLEIAVRTLQRWQKTLQEENTLADHRQAAVFVNEVVAFIDHAALRSCLLSA